MDVLDSELLKETGTIPKKGKKCAQNSQNESRQVITITTHLGSQWKMHFHVLWVYWTQNYHKTKPKYLKKAKNTVRNSGGYWPLTKGFGDFAGVSSCEKTSKEAITYQQYPSSQEIQGQYCPNVSETVEPVTDQLAGIKRQEQIVHGQNGFQRCEERFHRWWEAGGSRAELATWWLLTKKASQSQEIVTSVCSKMIITQQWWHQSKKGFQIMGKLQNRYNLVYNKSHIKQVENRQLSALKTE